MNGPEPELNWVVRNITWLINKMQAKKKNETQEADFLVSFLTNKKKIIFLGIY